jgi:hypothetical protein
MLHAGPAVLPDWCFHDPRKNTYLLKSFRPSTETIKTVAQLNGMSFGGENQDCIKCSLEGQKVSLPMHQLWRFVNEEGGYYTVCM